MFKTKSPSEMELSFEIEDTGSGRLMAFCVQERGLVVSGASLDEIMREIPKAYAALLAAGPLHDGDRGRNGGSTFEPRLRQITVAA